MSFALHLSQAPPNCSPLCRCGPPPQTPSCGPSPHARCELSQMPTIQCAVWHNALIAAFKCSDCRKTSVIRFCTSWLRCKPGLLESGPMVGDVRNEKKSPLSMSLLPMHCPQPGLSNVTTCAPPLPHTADGQKQLWTAGATSFLAAAQEHAVVMRDLPPRPPLGQEVCLWTAVSQWS